MTIEEQARAALADALATGVEAHAIVMHPAKLKQWLREQRPDQQLAARPDGSGWAMLDLPIYRSWEVYGVAILTRYMFEMIRERNPAILF